MNARLMKEEKTAKRSLVADADGADGEGGEQERLSGDELLY